MNIKPNNGKSLVITVNSLSYSRYPIKTHIISENDDIVDVVKKYTKNKLKPKDIVVISERVVAITQGRSILIDNIHPSWWANTLSRFVYDHPGGIGLRSPWTMELAIQEVGLLRILFAGLFSLITKPFGIRGVFYYIVGGGINAIDGPAPYTLPPGNKSATLGPKKPNKVAKEIADAINHPVIIIDANDYGVNVLGSADPLTCRSADLPIRQIFSDNPMGQSHEQTPIIIVRKNK